MSYNILYFLMENSISLLIGILSANLVGSIGYIIWLFLQKGAAKFYVEKGISFLKILLMSFILPILLAIPLWCILQVRRKNWAGIGFTMPMKIGIALLAFVWLVATTIILIYRYVSYWRVRYLSLMNVPLEDEEIQNIVDKWKTKLKIKKRITVFYNENMTSPALVYYNGYKILLPTYEMSELEINVALLHELMHLKNRDIFTKNIGFVVNAMHSFNLITHAIRQEIGKWEEVNCDFCCRQTGKEEFDSKEYFRCIMNLKERYGDVAHPDIMCCLFEVKDLLKFRIDVAQQMPEERKHSNRSVIVAAVLAVMGMFLSFFVVTYGISYCYDKTITYIEEKQEDKCERFQEITKEEFLKDAKISYFDGNILNSAEGIKMQLEPGEIKVFTFPEGYSGILSVMIVANGNPYRLGFMKNEEQIRYIDDVMDACTKIDTEEIEGNDLFIKNTGNQICQMEVFIVESTE